MLQRALTFIALTCACTSCACARSQALHELVETYFEEMLLFEPVTATFLGDPRYHDRLINDIAPQEVNRRREFEQKYLDAALRISFEHLDTADQLTWSVFVQQRRSAIAGAQFPRHLLPVDQLYSLPLLMPILASGISAQPFVTAADYDAFLRRMKSYVRWSDQAIVNMREGVRQRTVQPRVVIERLLVQLDELVSEDPKSSLFYQSIQRLPGDLALSERQRIAREYQSAIREHITPAYRRLRDFLQHEYLKHARSTVAWTALPQGMQWYAYEVERSTTTQLTPAAIHEMGLKEVARIRSEMEQVRRAVGFEGDLNDFFRHLQTDPKFFFASEAELLQAYQNVTRKIDALLPRLFSEFPEADYEVRAVEAFRAASAAGASYQEPSADGSRPGIFYINTYNLKAQPRYGVETLSLHEAAPGHHFQIALQQQLTNLPRFRRFGGYTAYMEGWALYAESLGRELGLFTDPYQYYGRLNDEMLRAMRLVVDTGLHTRGWSRERAIEYMLANSSLAASDVAAEVERYIANPAQALSYKVGQFKIADLRARAETCLGKEFDIKEFHREVLHDGALPLEVLDAKIEGWMRRKAHGCQGSSAQVIRHASRSE